MGCADVGPARENRSAVAVSGELTQGECAGKHCPRTGERLRSCNVRNMNPERAEGLSPELQTAREPLLLAMESLSEQIREYNERIENMAQQSYPPVALLKQ